MPEENRKQKMSSLEKDFWQALTRLKENKPKTTDLRNRQSGKQVRITISAVAAEAGHSRTLISHAGCRFPEVRAEILKLTRNGNVPIKSGEVIRKLRSTNKELAQQVRLLRSQNAALILRVQSIQDESNRATAAAERRAARGKRESRALAGTRLRKPVADADVIEITYSEANRGLRRDTDSR